MPFFEKKWSAPVEKQQTKFSSTIWFRSHHAPPFVIFTLQSVSRRKTIREYTQSSTISSYVNGKMYLLNEGLVSWRRKNMNLLSRRRRGKKETLAAITINSIESYFFAKTTCFLSSFFLWSFKDCLLTLLSQVKRRSKRRKMTK